MKPRAQVCPKNMPWQRMVGKKVLYHLAMSEYEWKMQVRSALLVPVQRSGCGSIE